VAEEEEEEVVVVAVVVENVHEIFYLVLFELVIVENSN
jgi:hypothetical protein